MVRRETSSKKWVNKKLTNCYNFFFLRKSIKSHRTKKCLVNIKAKTWFTSNLDHTFTVLLNSHDWSCTSNRRWIKFTRVFAFSSIHCCPHWPPTSTINKADPITTFKAIAKKCQLYLLNGKNKRWVGTEILSLWIIRLSLSLYSSISYCYHNNDFTSRERFV